MKPSVSVILPTYNRAGHLRQAFASIRAQEFRDWELIVVDDGSRDGTRELVAELSADLARPVRYHYQENRGAYAARNTGLDLAGGDYVAFFDSDDRWLPHHLGDCVRALEAHPEVDRVGAACRCVEAATGRVVVPNTFHAGGKPRPFLKLRARHDGPLRILDDPRTLRCALLGGVNSGLQSSVARRRLFDEFRFKTQYRNEAEDVLFLIRLVAAGKRLAFFDEVHVIYNMHGEHSSAASAGGRVALEKHLDIFSALVRGFEDLREELRLAPAESRALDRRIARGYFWELGYPLLRDGRKAEAMAMFRRALRLDPLCIPYWKTYLVSAMRGAAVPS